MSISTRFSLERQKLGCPQTPTLLDSVREPSVFAPGEISVSSVRILNLPKARPANFDRARVRNITRPAPRAAARACLYVLIPEFNKFYDYRLGLPHGFPTSCFCGYWHWTTVRAATATPRGHLFRGCAGS